MIDKIYNSLDNRNQGNILIICGTVLLLNSLGIIGLNFLIAIIAIYMIWYGLDRADYIQKILELIRRNNS